MFCFIFSCLVCVCFSYSHLLSTLDVFKKGAGIISLLQPAPLQSTDWNKYRNVFSGGHMPGALIVKAQ